MEEEYQRKKKSLSNTQNRIKKKKYLLSTSDYYRLYYVNDKGQFVLDHSKIDSDLEDSYGMWEDDVP